MCYHENATLLMILYVYKYVCFIIQKINVQLKVNVTNTTLKSAKYISPTFIVAKFNYSVYTYIYIYISLHVSGFSEISSLINYSMKFDFTAIKMKRVMININCLVQPSSTFLQFVLIIEITRRKMFQKNKKNLKNILLYLTHYHHLSLHF